MNVRFPTYFPHSTRLATKDGKGGPDLPTEGQAQEAPIVSDSLVISLDPAPSWPSQIEAAVAEGVDVGPANEELNQTARTLFQEAYLSETRSETAVSSFERFLALVDQSSLGNDYVTFLSRLSQPNLNQEDRVLLFNYVEADGSSRSGLGLRLRSRVLHHFRQRAISHNSWARDEVVNSESAAFMECFPLVVALAELPPNYLDVLVERNARMLCSVLRQSDSARYLNMDSDEFSFILRQARAEAQGLPVGSDQRANAFRRLSDLQVIDQARTALGTNQVEGPSRRGPARRSRWAGTEPEDWSRLARLREAALSPERADNIRHRDLFCLTLADFQRRYLQSAIGSPERSGLANFTTALHNMAGDFGVTQIEIDQSFASVARELGLSPRPTSAVGALADLDDQTTYSVSPEGLPTEIRALLEASGHWALVRDNIREIILTPEIIDESRTVGLAHFALGTIEVETQPAREGWEIAATLIHEATHLSWRRNISLGLQELLPDERNAYLAQAQFLESYLCQGVENGTIDPSSPLAQQIALSVARARLMAQGANNVLGYPLDNFDLNVQEQPSAELISERGLDSISELNLAQHPERAALSLMQQEGRLEGLMPTVGFADQRYIAPALPILRDILAGEARLYGSFETGREADGSFSRISEQTFRLEYNNGRVRELSRREIAALLVFSNGVYGRIQPGRSVSVSYASDRSLVTLLRLSGERPRASGITRFCFGPLELAESLYNLQYFHDADQLLSSQ